MDKKVTEAAAVKIRPTKEEQLAFAESLLARSRVRNEALRATNLQLRKELDIK